MNYGVFGLHVFVRFIPLAALLHSPSAWEITLELTILKGGSPPPFQRNQMLLGISFRSFSFLSQNWETQKSIVWGSWVPCFR